MAHIINRLQLEVRCADEAQAFNLRRNFAVTFGEQIAEAADAICSQYVGEEEWLRIDKLEIDLGHFTQHAFSESFGPVFKSKFEKELKQKLSGIAPAQKKVSQQLSKRSLFFYFLHKGVLPWWADASIINIDEIAVELLALQPEIVKQFIYQNRFEKKVWKRIAFQLNREIKAQIITLIEELDNWKKAFVIWLQEAMLFIKNNTGITAVFHEEIINDVVVSNAPVIFHSSGEKNIFWQLATANATILFEENSTVIQQALYEYEMVLIKEEKEGHINNITQKQPTNKQENPSQINEAFAKTITDETSLNDQENKEEKYLIKHSGIVLLSPFLKSFFANIKLLHQDEWKDKAAQYKAIFLLKYLSTGERKIPEYNLALEKIICGISIEEPVPVEIELKEEETSEADDLLQSVIAHWKALKHTSINGLRVSFLERDGILQRRESGWLLQVEHKTPDVLIDSIPWGYSTLSFPWNEYLIFVEW